MLTKHSQSEILNLNFEKKTFDLNCNFPISLSAIVIPERIQYVIHSWALECSGGHNLLIMQNTSLRVWKLKTPVRHTKQATFTHTTF